MTARRDPLLESGTRLALCALLQGARWVEFATARDVLEVADSSVSKNARTLEDAGYLEIAKGAVGRRPRTWFRLTPAGHHALTGHLAWLDGLRAPTPAGLHDSPGPPVSTAVLRPEA